LSTLASTNPVHYVFFPSVSHRLTSMMNRFRDDYMAPGPNKPNGT